MDFENLKEKVNFLEYLKKDGWIVNEKKCTPQSKYQVIKKNNKTLLVFYPSSNRTYQIAKEPPLGKSFNIIQYCMKDQGMNFKNIINKFKNYSPSKIDITLKKEQKPKPKKHKNYNWVKKYYCYGDIEVPDLDNYFLKKRKFTKKIFQHPRLQNIYFHPERKNLIIPHYDLENENIITAQFISTEQKIFPKDTTKTLYITPTFPNDKKIIITESVLDLISYYCLNQKELDTTIGIDTAGNPSILGKEKLEKTIEKFKKQEIIYGFDNDNAGQQLMALVNEIVEKTNKKRKRKTSKISLPKNKDLNDLLVKKTSNKNKIQI